MLIDRRPRIASRALTTPLAPLARRATRACTREVALEAVQLFDGNGYIVRVSSRAALPGRQGASDLGGTDEIQVSQIALSLMSER